MDRVTVYRIGFWSSVLVTLSVIAFGLFMIIGMFGVDTLQYSFVACFILAPSFVALMVANHHYASEKTKIWSHLGLVFAIIYAVFITFVYYLEIAIVLNKKLLYSEEIMRLLVFTPGSALFAIDMLGYAFMSLATFFVAFIYGNSSLERWLKRLLILNGLFFLPSLIFPVLVPYAELSPEPNVIAALGYIFWCTLFSTISILSALLYKRLIKTDNF